MKITGDTVRAMNKALVEIELSEERSEQLTIELNQLKSAIESVRQKVDFDTDPHDFQRALLEVAEQSR